MSEREWEDEKKLMTYALVFDGWQIITHSHNNISKQIQKTKVNWKKSEGWAPDCIVESAIWLKTSVKPSLL